MTAPTLKAIWHDIECGSYTADRSIWMQLAEAASGPILDIGAGTGRIALRLAEAGYEITALDKDCDLLAALSHRARARNLVLNCVTADATAIDLGDQVFSLAIMPMQTIQLLTSEERQSFFVRIIRHLQPNALLAIAIADSLEPVPHDSGVIIAADARCEQGISYVSQIVAMPDIGDGIRIERKRVTSNGATTTAESDVIELKYMTVSQLQAEAHSVGLRLEGVITVPPCDAYVDSKVVLLRA